MSEESQHRTPEQRIEDREDIQTFDDLDGLTNERLMEIALQCLTEPADPDACVSCRAFVTLEEREATDMARAKQALENPTGEPDVEEVPPGALDLTDEEIAELPILPPLPEEPEEETDIRLLFINMVHELDATTRRLMEGPPIPPRNVTLTDLAALKIGAEEWLKICRQRAEEGYTLAPEKQRIYDAVEAVVRRIQ